MRRLIGCMLIGVLLASGVPTGAKPAHSAGERKISADYVQALGAASRFLAAWVTRDQDRGPLTVSARLKKVHTNDGLQGYFSGVSNPGHEGYEILPGKRISANRYSFAVRLYEYYTADKKPQRRPPLVHLIVVRDKTASEGWAVDNLPQYWLHY